MGIKFIVRVTIQHVGEHAEESVYLQQKQSSNTHPEECRCRRPPNEEHQRDDLNHLCGAVLLGLCFPLAGCLVLSLTPDWPRALPNTPGHHLAKMDSRAKMMGGFIRIDHAWHALPFDP